MPVASRGGSAPRRRVGASNSERRATCSAPCALHGDDDRHPTQPTDPNVLPAAARSRKSREGCFGCRYAKVLVILNTMMKTQTPWQPNHNPIMERQPLDIQHRCWGARRHTLKQVLKTLTGSAALKRSSAHETCAPPPRHPPVSCGDSFRTYRGGRCSSARRTGPAPARSADCPA